MERFLTSFSSAKRITYDVVLFRNIGGDTIGTMIIPSAHPGPMGELGSSNMPDIVMETIEKKLKIPGRVHVYHSFSGHDQNLSSGKEVQKLSEAIYKTVSKLQKSNPSIPKRQKVKSEYFRADSDYPVLGLGLGSKALVIFCPSIKGADDIDPEVVYDFSDNPALLFVDAHNCTAKGIKNIKKGSVEAKTMLEAVRKVLFHLDPTMPTMHSFGPFQKPALAGFSDQFCSSASGIGPGGIRAVSLGYADGINICLILVDGNNMVRGLREEIRQRILEHFADCEVLTTDSHLLSVVPGGFNPVGYKSRGDIVEVCIKASLQSLKRMEPVEVVSGKEHITLRSYNRGDNEKLAQTINQTFRLLPSAFGLGLAFMTAGILIFAILV